MSQNINFHPIYEIFREPIEQLQWIFNGAIDWYNGESIVDPRAAEYMLPRENGEVHEDYLRRLKRARWKNLFRGTIDTLAGFLSKFSIRPETIAYLGEEKAKEILSNVDLLGSDLNAFLLACDRASLRDGFCAVLIDYTRDGEGRPFFTRIDRPDIIDWSYSYEESGRMRLDRLLFVRSLYERQDNGDYKLRYEYIEVYSDRYEIRHSYEPAIPSESKKEVIIEKTTLPKSEGEVLVVPHTFGDIPIVFYPDNTIAPFELHPPLVAIADANRTWYQINSDLRESLHYKSNPVYVREGLINSPDDVPPAIKLGPRHALDIPAGAKFYIVETTGDAINLNREYLKDIEAEIQSYTMDFVSAGDRSGTEAALIGARNQANLALFSVRKQSAVEEMFRAFDRWLGKESIGGGIKMDLSQFKVFDPNYFRELKDLLLAGRLSDEVFWKLVSAIGGVPSNVDISEIVPESLPSPPDSEGIGDRSPAGRMEL